MSKCSIFYAVKKFSLCLLKRNLVKRVNEFNRNDKKINKQSSKKENYMYIFQLKETVLMLVIWSDNEELLIFVDSITPFGQKR